MDFAKSRSRRRQGGFSLISLMVGLMLSLLCIVAAMHAYRVSVLNARNSAIASRDNNVTASLAIQLGKLLPKAGWGLGATEPQPGGRLNTDLVLLNDAQFATGRLSGSDVAIGSASQAGNALVWASALEGSTQCYALVATRSTGLLLLGPQVCASASAAIQGNWTPGVTLVPADVLPSLKFAVTTAQCWPFGGSMARTAAQVSVTGTKYPLPATCLLNIQG